MITQYVLPDHCGSKKVATEEMWVLSLQEDCDHQINPGLENIVIS